MSQHHYNAPRPAFGKMQGAGVAMPRARMATPAWNAPSGGPQAAAAVAVPQVPQYADIVGDAFTGRSSHGGSATGRPVKFLRFVSGFIDVFVLGLIAFVLIFLQVSTGAADAEIAGDGKVQFFIIFGIICFGYGLVMEASALQGTIGKILTGTIVVNRDGERLSFGQSLGRNLGKILSGCVPAYIPYLMVFWTQNNQTLHDIMSGTHVYRRGDVPQSYSETFA